jgi:hypothetical protein
MRGELFHSIQPYVPGAGPLLPTRFHTESSPYQGDSFCGVHSTIRLRFFDIKQLKI